MIDPILGTQSYNLAGSLMTMQGRYALLRQELERNPVRRVYLEVSNNTMSRARAIEGTEGDLYLLARLSGCFRRMQFFLSAFSASEYIGTYQRFLSEGIDATAALFSGEAPKHTERDRGYFPCELRSEDFEPNYFGTYHSKQYATQIDPDNLAYLDAILRLCREHEVEVVLVMTPIARSGMFEYNNAQVLYDWYQTLAQREGLRYYDFNLLRDKEGLFPDESMYYDALHFNDEGATRFSGLFAELMLRADAGEDISGLFYRSYQEMEQSVLGG